MPGTYVDERTVIADILDGLTGVVIGWPNTDTDDDDLPVPGSNPEAPVRYVAVMMSSAGDNPLTIGGSRQIDGAVTTTVWVERNAGDDYLRQTVDALCALFDAGDDPTQGFYLTRRFLDEPGDSVDREWRGQRIVHHFTRFRS